LILKRAKRERVQLIFLIDFIKKKMNETLRKKLISMLKKESYRIKRNMLQISAENMMSLESIKSQMNFIINN